MNPIDSIMYLWPPSKQKQVAEVFKGVELHEGMQRPKEVEMDRCISILINQPLPVVLNHLGAGYSHVIQKSRDDYAYSLLSTALIFKNPKAFFKNPMPFLFRSFETGLANVKSKMFKSDWSDSTEKMKLIDLSLKHIENYPRAKPYRDILAANLDELLSNARASEPRAAVPIVVAVSTDRLCLMVADHHLKFSSNKIRERLMEVSQDEKWSPTSSKAGGAGLGLPFLMGNSTTFYLAHSRGGGGISISLIDVRKGLRDLEQTPKNVHIFSI